MIWLLDTNTLIFAARGRPRLVRERLERLSPDDLAVSSISIAELWFGAEKCEDPHKKKQAWTKFLEPYTILPFARPEAEEHARLRRALRHAPIGERDLMIAAIASANKLAVVSNNVSEFGRVPGLKVEDWSRLTPSGS